MTTAGALANFIQSQTKLNNLSLYGNPLGDAGIEVICQALENNQTVTRLSLQDTKIGEAGSKAIAQMLVKNSSLKWLDVRDNTLDSIILAEALTHNENLIKLEISDQSFALWQNTKAREQALMGKYQQSGYARKPLLHYRHHSMSKDELQIEMLRQQIALLKGESKNKPTITPAWDRKRGAPTQGITLGVNSKTTTSRSPRHSPK